MTDLGLTVHTGKSTTAIETHDDSVRATLSDGTTIDAGLLVFSAGIRPRDELARVCGLDVAERGGVLTDIACRTSDPYVYAIGEVAAIEGRCYGLVAPGNASAEVVADRLLGGTAEFPGADMSTKLKLLGVDVASFGDAHATTDGALEVVLNDPTKGTYAELVVSDDASTLLGGILIGDATAYGTLRPLVGRPLPADPASLIAPHGAEVGVGALPDEAQSVLVQRGQQGCDLLGDLRRRVRRARDQGQHCCRNILWQLHSDAQAAAAGSGVEQSKALCEHFNQSRAELFQIVAATDIRTFSGLIAKYGTGTGCDICKPAVASILASTSSDHVLDGETAALQDTNDHFLANLQRNGTYSVVPRLPGGEITPEQLIAIGEVARDFGLYTKITGGQRIDMFGARVEQLPLIWKRLVDAGMESGHAYGKALRTVKSCVGSTWCRYGVQDSVAMAVDLELRYRGLRSPHKVKMGVSGCQRECAEARSKDVGVIATEKGWNLYVGGNGGATPKHAQLLAGDLDSDDPGPLHRSLPDVLHPHGRPAAADSGVAGKH